MVKPDEISTLWEETLPPTKVVLTRFETGDAVYIGVVTAGVQVSTSNKMVGNAWGSKGLFLTGASEK